MGGLSERLGVLETRCVERESILRTVSKYYPRTLAAMAVVGALLWGYFEYRVYPEIIQAQNDVHQLRKEMYIYMIDRRSKTKGVTWAIDSVSGAGSVLAPVVIHSDYFSAKSSDTVTVPYSRDTVASLHKNDTTGRERASYDAGNITNFLRLPWTLRPISPERSVLTPAIVTYSPDM